MKRIINTLLLLSVAIIAMAQTSFVVADKNGNSQLVQSLVFQQQQTADRFSWKSDGSANGDINDLLFIARAKNQLSTANTEDVTKMLEELSGTDLADAEAIATALKTNPNVEEASTGDGNTVAVKLADSEGCIYYPMYNLQSIFTEEDIPSEAKAILAAPRQIRKASIGAYTGKVAIFNYFRDSEKYNVQNHIITQLISFFKDCGYDVRDMPLTLENAKMVTSREHQFEYDAIIFMTHGVVPSGRTPMIATRDVCTAMSKDTQAYHDPDDGKNYLLTFVEELLETVSSPIVYLGACDGTPQGGYKWKNAADETRFPRLNNTTVVGWSGKTRIAQAHAALMFYYMLYGGYTMPQALDGLPDKDSNYSDSQLHMFNVSDLKNLEGKTFSYNDYFSATVFKGKPKTGNYGEIRQTFQIELSNVPFKCWLKTQLRNILTNEVYLAKTAIVEKGEDLIYRPTFEVWQDGMYSLELYPMNKDEEDYGSKRIRLIRPVCIIKSDHFKDLSATIEFDDDDLIAPQILGSDGQPLEEVTIPAGTSQTYQIDAYPGHTFKTPCLDKNVCTLSISGTTLTVTGVSEGSTMFGVYDEQNRQMGVVQVTVTAGGGGDIVAYTSCPDDHHPHLIDLGLPSGTKWACCNVGAQKPEDYGGYFAWGETKTKSSYTWENYAYYNSSTYIGSDIAGTQYDAATANWGSPWVMPNNEQMEELKNCASEWTTENGVYGRRFTGSNGASIFLPAAGIRWKDALYYAGSDGFYWSSMPYESDPDDAWDIGFGTEGVDTGYDPRLYGQSVRPVKAEAAPEYPDLQLSETQLSIVAGASTTVEITSGSGEYGVTNLNSSLARATLQGTTITISALAEGDAKVVATDMQSGQKIIIEITVTSGGDIVAYTSCPDSHHPHLIDLGLPSGTKWACCNVGASKPEEYGGYYAWGETTEKSRYYWDTYIHCDGSSSTCHDIGKDISGTQYDAATVNWGSPWVMPNLEQMEELKNSSTSEWTTENGVNGRRFTGPNGASIFLPAAGYRWGGDLSRAGSYGFYWSSTLLESGTSNAWDLYFYSGHVYTYGGDLRTYGNSVRPVCKN